jgi:hypothetical protein
MEKMIRFESVRDTFGFNMPSRDVFATYFPDNIDASEVVASLTDRSDLVTNPIIADSAALLRRKPTKGQQQAVTAIIHPDVTDEAVVTHLEEEFNLLARPWQANYAGTWVGDTSSPVYTIIEGLSDELQEFLAIEQDEERIALQALTGIMEPAIVIIGEDPKKFGMPHTITDRYFDFARDKRDFSRAH